LTSLPNLLAVARILMTPAIMALVLAGGAVEHNYTYAVALFVIAAVTDFLDGFFARRWNIGTVLGAFLDSTADKLLVTGSLLALIAVERASVWVALIIIIREFMVMALRGMAALEGRVVKPSIWGKLKANAQFIAIGLAMIRTAEPLGPLYLDEWMMWLAAAVTIASGWQYVSRFWSVVRAADRS
jgi:CDP-diacylglycerol--glycerol-3-phosphate 3-phosphatidyltransferase